MANPSKLEDVRREELVDIEQRRTRVELPSQDVARDLVGLALSGGALRSASFSLGVVQALQRLGLWRYVDYMSTVSGGGYIGAYLTSSALKDKQPVTQDHQPLLEPDSEKQPSRVKRFIYGGHYLLRPWRFINTYLMGLFFINLALFSGLLAVCAGTAFLWRCLDYPAIRDRAKLLSEGLANDLTMPFWPFFLFGLAWLAAWGISLFQRGSEAKGITARYCLFFTLASLLIGFALLIGNGDIAVWSGDPISLGGKVWGPIVGLILGGLVPFLTPKRLLQSGLNPQKDWERYVFAAASAALLVGIPLLLVGWFARENISGYNTSSQRPVLAADIDDWPALASLLPPHLAPPPDSAEAAPLGQTAAARSAGTAGTTNSVPDEPKGLLSAVVMAPAAVLQPLLQGLRGTATPLSREQSPDREQAYTEDFRRAFRETDVQLKANAIRAFVSVDLKTRRVDVEDFPQTLVAQLVADGFLSQRTGKLQLGGMKVEQIPAVVATVADRLTEVDFSQLEGRDEERFLEALHTSPDRRTPFQQAFVDLFLGNFLQATAAELKREFVSFDRAAADFLGREEWRSWSLPHFIQRFTEVVTWRLAKNNVAVTYWETKRALERRESDFALAFNELLRSPPFVTEYLTATETDGTEGPAATPRIQALLATAHLTEEREWPPYRRHELSRLLLERDFPTIFRSRQVIQRRVSIDQDQKTRLIWLATSLGVFVLVGMWVDLNALSLQRYYRDRLTQTFLVPRNVKSPSLPLSELATTEYGGPYHLIGASVGLMRKSLRYGEDEFRGLAESRREQDERCVDSFIFSRRYCGSEITGYVDTVAYEHSVPGYTHKLDLAEATALSGAAISPGYVQNWLLAFLILAMNLSLGQWVPNPLMGRPRTRPRVLALLLGLFRRAEQRPFVFISDGGHAENLGLVQLLKRRCKLVIVVDASCDPRHEFHDLGRAMRIARVHGGVKLVALEQDHGADRELRGEELRLSQGEDGVDAGDARRHFFLARILYPNAEEGLLLYVKPSFTGDESVDLEQFRKQNKDFPHDPVSDQLYDESQVEAYRQLGYHIGMQLQGLMPEQFRGGRLWTTGSKVTTDQICQWFTAACLTPVTPSQKAPSPAEPTSVLGQVASRPLVKKILAGMKRQHAEAADIESATLRQMLAHDQSFADVTPDGAVAAIRSAVVDRQHHSANDREYCVWLLRALESDAAVPSSLSETIDVLLTAARPEHPERVRLAAISTVSILGRNEQHRDRVREALRNLKPDPKGTVRLAIKNALSNLQDSPAKPR